MAERKALTEAEFEAATDVYLENGKDKIVPKPATWEDGKYFSTPAPDAAPDPAADEGEGAVKPVLVDKGETETEGGDIDQFVDVLLADAVKLKPGLTADHIIAGAQRMKTVSGGGRRRSKRRQPKRSAKQSKKGGRRSSKNRRKHSHRSRKH